MIRKRGSTFSCGVPAALFRVLVISVAVQLGLTLAAVVATLGGAV